MNMNVLFHVNAVEQITLIISSEVNFHLYQMYPQEKLDWQQVNKKHKKSLY